MTSATDTMPPIMAKKTPPPDDEKRGRGRPPGARPTVTVFARVAPELGEAFAAEVSKLRPKTSVNAVVEMLIEEWLKDRGAWPAPSDE